MTKFGVRGMIKTPISQMGRKVRCYIKAVGPPFEPLRKSKQGEVVQMWKKRIFKVICFLAGFAILMCLSSINAC